jgi:hypothetical protein
LPALRMPKRYRASPCSMPARAARRQALITNGGRVLAVTGVGAIWMRR